MDLRTESQIQNPSLEAVEEPGWAPLAVLMGGTFLVILDFFIVNVALPSMQRDLHASDSGLEWVVAGYGLTFSSLLIASTRLGDQWGRRRMFSLGTGLFVAASAACGLAPSMELLIGARMLQGVSGAMVSPMVLALIGDVYAGPRMPRAIGVYSMVMGLAAATGQLIGGVLIQLDLAGSGWRAIFWVNVPIGLAALMLAPRLLPDRRIAGAQRLDLCEVALATGTLTALLLPLLEGRRVGWPLWTWASLGASLVLAVLTVARGRAQLRRGRRPLIEPLAFRIPNVRVSIACQGLLFAGQASYFVVLALFLQDGRGLGPLASGGVFTLVAVPYIAGTALQPRLAQALDRWTVPVGAGLFCAGHLALLAEVREHGVGGPLIDLLPGLALAGLGMGVTLTRLIDVAMGGVEPAYAAAVSGVMSTVQQVGNALGVAVVGMVFFAALPGGYAHAMEWALAVLAGTTAGVGAAGALLHPRHSLVEEGALAPVSKPR
jgi:MFS family permease